MSRGSVAVLQVLANPIFWLAAYTMFRVFFTTPGRPPMDEDMTND